MVVTGDITQIDLPKDQSSGLVVVVEILEGIEGIEFVRFGGRGRRAPPARAADRRGLRRARREPDLRAAARRAPTCLRSTLARDRGARRHDASAPGGDRAARRARAGLGRGPRRPRRDRVRRAPTGSPSSTPSTAARRGRRTCCRFPIDGDEPLGAAPARARRHRHLPAAHRPTCARRSSTARCTSSGMDHETDDGEMLALQRELLAWVTPSPTAMSRGRASSRSRAARTSASRRSSTRSSATRSRSSPTSRRRPAGRSAASPRAATASSCSSTCPASSARATR